MLISPECSNCTKAILEGKADPHTHQFFTVQMREVRKTHWFSVLLLLQLWAGSRSKLLHMPSSHQDLHQHDSSMPARAGKSQIPSFASCMSLLPAHTASDRCGVESGHCPVSFPGQSSPSPGQHSAASGIWRFNFWSSPHPSSQLDTAEKTNDGMNCGVCCYIKLYHSHN